MLAKGVQIYECAQKPDGSFEWAFKAPEAALADARANPSLVAAAGYALFARVPGGGSYGALAVTAASGALVGRR